jgi:hypothetical protein
MRDRRFGQTIGTFVAYLLVATSAVAAPDFTDVQDFAFPAPCACSVRVTVEVYLEGNPDDPFPGDSFNTYLYELKNGLNSIASLVSFALTIPDAAAVSSLPASAGSGVAPDGPGQISGSEVEWSFVNTPIATGQTSQKMVLLSTYTPGNSPIEVNGGPWTALGPLNAPSTPTPTPTPSATMTPTPTDTATPTNTLVPDGGDCGDPADCLSGNCVYDTCCAQASCPPGESCDNPGNEGTCSPDLGPAAAPAVSVSGLLLAVALVIAVGGAAILRRRGAL